LGWALAFHVLNNIGFAHSLPVALSLYSRMAPRGTCGTMIALCYLHLFAANLLVGWLGAMYEPTLAVSFWLLHSGIIAAGAIVLFGVWLVLGSRFAAEPQKLTERATNIRASFTAIAE
jgi:POT family proton-dependent oligopeptide transporter